MGELARGTVADRPWGRTLATLGLRGLTGQLVLGADGKRYQIAFEGGAVVAAASPLVSDAAVRVALTSGLLSSTQVAEVARRQAATPQRDEIEVIADMLRLGTDQTLRLRRRTIAQRAARTFSIDRGDFVVVDRISLPVYAGTELDIRSIIFLGATQNLSEHRLAAELASYGNRFRLRPEAVEDLPQFGFGGEVERIAFERLRSEASLEELEVYAEIRTVRAMLYALMACGACDASGASTSAVPAATPPSADGSTRVTSPSTSHAIRSAPRGAAPKVDGSGAVRRDRVVAAATAQRTRGASAQRPVSAPAKDTRPRSESKQSVDVLRVIAQRLELVKAGVDHYELLGVSIDAPFGDIRKAYFALARQLHPDRLSALGIVDENRDAQRLFAQVNTAFAVLSDPDRRTQYTDILRRGGEAAIRAEEAQAEQLAARIFASEEAFRRGEAALRRDQLSTAIAELTQAVELNPEEGDYLSMLAWAQFCASPDKAAIASATRVALDRAIAKSPRAVSGRFYLGRVERMLGRDHDALRHFKDVLRLDPHHEEAATEARVIEARLGGRLTRR